MNIKVESVVEVPCDFAFAWHMRPGALKRLLPPWSKVDFLFPPPIPSDKAQVGLKVHQGPFFFKWILEHNQLEQGFSDKQIKGPFSDYLHIHKFIPVDSHSCILSDEIEFSTFSFLEKSIQKKLLTLLHWRQGVIKEDLQLLYKYQGPPLKILLSGASGFIGSLLKIFLQLAGHNVIRLVRHEQEIDCDAVYWDPISGQFSEQDLENFDAVFHLAGAPIAHRWTNNYRRKLFISRCRDSRLLSQALSRLHFPPKTIISASAIGFYGDRREELTEDSSPGKGFLASLCQEWESAWETMEKRGSRIVYARFGVVLGAKGGMLHQILPLYRLGLGGRIGDGNQYLSWIGIDDAVSALYHLLLTEEVGGAVNIVAPYPIKQKEFSAILANKLHRMQLCHLSSRLVSLVFGDMGKEMLLSSTRSYPQKLLESGYSFRYPRMQEALRWVM